MSRRTEVIDVSHVHTDKFHQYRNDTGPFNTAAEVFHGLAEIPEGHINLDDRRQLCVTGWAPAAGVDVHSADHLPITITGFIRLKPKAPEQ